ncbi:hypothetical protein N665_0462s0009 [Sinapis alba]|nr:hypothetical protein N665_0462s0009 [Sinapis alba]
MGSRRRSCCLKPSLSVLLSLWIIFLSTLNSQEFTVTAPLCVSGSSPDEPFTRDSYFSIPMSTESVSSLWRYVAKSWSLSAHEDLPVAAPLLSTGSNSWILQRPDLKIPWHLSCALSFWMVITLPTGKSCSLSLLDEPANGFAQYWNNTPAVKSSMANFQIQHLLLLSFSEPNHNSQCVWSFKPPLVKKDYRLWYYPLCLLHYLWYGNAEVQSYVGTVTSYVLSEHMEVDKLLHNCEAHVNLLGGAMGFWTKIKVLTNQPLTAISTTRLSTPSFHILEKQKLVSGSPLNLIILEKFIKTSSRQGRERSFSTSFFSKKRIIPPTSLFVRGDTILDFKTRKKYQLPSRLLSCVKVHLGPVDAAIFIWLRVEVLDGAATSQFIVTNRLLFEEFEVWFKSFLDWITSGNFDILHNSLSNLFKFVSLSMYSFEFYVLVSTFWFAHHDLYDVATIAVNV